MPLHRILSGSTIALLVLTVAGLSNAEAASGTRLRGTVESGGTGPTPLINNPGGNSIAVLVGVAAPLKTPLIGTPRSFDRLQDRGREAHAD